MHAIKVFDGPVERSLRLHGAIRPFPFSSTFKIRVPSFFADATRT